MATIIRMSPTVTSSPLEIFSSSQGLPFISATNRSRKTTDSRATTDNVIPIPTVIATAKRTPTTVTSWATAKFEAAVAGNNGWFWRNRKSAPVPVTLKTKGAYSEIKRML